MTKKEEAHTQACKSALGGSGGETKRIATFDYRTVAWKPTPSCACLQIKLSGSQRTDSWPRHAYRLMANANDEHALLITNLVLSGTKEFSQL